VLRSGWVSPPPVFWIFMEQEKIMEAEVPTVRVGATPTGLTAPPPTTPQGFLQAGCPSCRPTNSVKEQEAKVIWQRLHRMIPLLCYICDFEQINDRLID